MMTITVSIPFYFLKISRTTVNSSVKISTAKDYITSIENLVQQREYIQARQILQTAQGKFGNHRIFRALEAQILLGLKEYKTFHDKYQMKDFTTKPKVLLSVAQMYCDLQDYAAAQNILDQMIVNLSSDQITQLQSRNFN